MQKIDQEIFSKLFVKPSCVLMGCRNKVRFVFKSDIPYSDGSTRLIYTCKKHKEEANGCSKRKIEFIRDLKNGKARNK